MDKLDKKIEDIKKVLQPSMYHLFVGNEIISSEKIMRLLENDIKKNFDPPKKQIKGYIIRMKIDKNNKSIISINCDQVTITEKLIIKSLELDGFQTFTYTTDELLKHGFKMSHIKKMMKAIKNHTVRFDKSFISITELLNKI
jgi:hypothetical protein